MGKITRCGLCAALLAVSAFLAIPVGDMRFTMQTFALFFTLATLGGKWGTVTCLVYLLLGGLGVPIFAGFQGGVSVLLGPTGGYLWGFLAAGLTVWLLEKHLPLWASLALGMVVCYACGTLWYGFVYLEKGWGLVFLKCVLPYLLPDGLKLWLALYVRKRMGENL